MLLYWLKVKKLLKKPNSRVNISYSEIVPLYVNLMDAKNTLTDREYYWVKFFFSTFSENKQKINVNLDDLNKTIAHLKSTFDLIAPYYKISGEKNDFETYIAKKLEDEKVFYRKKALSLLTIYSCDHQEWSQLHAEFYEIFYKPFL